MAGRGVYSVKYVLILDIMKDTDKRRMFIVSFGNGREYKVTYEPATDGPAVLSPFVSLEKELNDYLARRFPGETFAYYTTPRVTEVDVRHEASYADYPTFDRAAVEDVKRELTREIEVMNSDREQNDNDPWGLGQGRMSDGISAN